MFWLAGDGPEWVGGAAWTVYTYARVQGRATTPPPQTVGRPRLPGPAKEGITFWFSRLNAEVSVN